MCVVLLLGVSGCGPKVPEDFTVSGKSLEHWLQKLKSPDVRTREKAIDALGNVGTVRPEVVPALTTALQDSAPSVRGKAALALLKIGPDAGSALEALTNIAKNDSDPEVRRIADRAAEKVQGKK